MMILRLKTNSLEFYRKGHRCRGIQVNKQSQGSKKKARRELFLIREKKRDKEALNQTILQNPNSTMEEMVAVLGVKLK